MQKLRSKLGLLIVFSCLTLAVGLMASTGSASAHQAGSRHRPSPRITMRLLPGHFKYHGRYVERAVIYGIGFNGCDSCANASAYDGCSSSCDSNCNNSCSASCSYGYYNVNTCGSSSACGNACGSYEGCPSACSSGSASGCANYHTCGSAGGSVSVGGSGVNVNSGNGGHVSVGASGVSISGSTSCSSACGSVSGSTSCSSHNGCYDGSSCDCANVQSNIPIYGQSVNLSQVPVNTFGEFRPLASNKGALSHVGNQSL